jgi:CHAT domain-containing protein/Tfp pilus assembly protein PilF
MGEYAKAEPLYLQAKEIRKKVLGENHPNYASSLHNLAGLYKSMGEYAKAEPLYLQAKEIYKKVLGENHPDYATSLNSLAALYSGMGENAKAEPLYLQAKEIYKKVLGENHPDYATSLNSLAALYRSMGENAKAEPLFLQAKEIFKKVLGENHPDYATSLNNLASLYGDMGEHAKAEPLYLQAKEIEKNVLGKNHPNYATSLNNLALLYNSMGEHAKAEPLYLQAIEIRKKVLGEKHPNYATSLNNLAGLYNSMGEHAKAEPLYLQAKEIYKKVLGENHTLYALSLNNLAALYNSMGENAKAEPLYLQAKEIRKKVLGENHPDYAASLNNLAELYRSMGENAKAEPLYLQAKEIYKKVFGENHPDYAQSLNNLAVLYESTGEHAKAEPLYLAAVKIFTDNQERTAEIQTEASQLLTAKKNALYWQNLLWGTAKNASTTVYEPIFRNRGAITMRQTFLRAVRQAKPETKPLVEELQKVTRTMSQLFNNPADPKAKIDVPKRLAELNEQYERLQRELAQKSDAFAEYQKKKKGTVADLQKLLPDDVVLIDYLTYHDQLCAFVITNKEIQRFELGEMKPIEAAIDLFREQLTNKESPRNVPLTGKKDDPVVLLREKLWQPLSKAIGAAKIVLICPDGPVCRLPFAALPGEDDAKYLIEERAIAVLPVPQMLFDLLAPRPEKKESPSLLLMGDVNFDAEPLDQEPGRARNPGIRWPMLAGTTKETEAIGAAYRMAHPNGKIETIRGDNAHDKNLKEKLSQFQYVHLATHGFFAPQGLTALAKKKNQPELMISSERTRPTGPNPGTLSGIVCSGANKNVSGSILTALDIAELDLTKVELAVLSACETGLGPTAGGEGVFGLQRAFHLGGARTTITSLWRVPDRATQELMSRFYQSRFEKGNKLGVLETLRQTQIWMLNSGAELGFTDRGFDPNETELKEAKKDKTPGKRTPPAYWAAFSLAGDWR